MYLYARVYMRIPVYTSNFGSMNSGVRTSARGFGGSGCSITYSTSSNGTPSSFAVYSGVSGNPAQGHMPAGGTCDHAAPSFDLHVRRLHRPSS